MGFHAARAHRSAQFLSGGRCYRAWIELRADDGSLARRFYFHIGHRSSLEGYPAFTSINESRPDSGIGAFLAAFFLLPEGKRDALIAPLNLMRSGAPGSSNIEDSIPGQIPVSEHSLQRFSCFRKENVTPSSRR